MTVKVAAATCAYRGYSWGWLSSFRRSSRTTTGRPSTLRKSVSFVMKRAQLARNAVAA